MQVRTLGLAAHGRDNNFNLLRMLAASAVLISHSVPLTLGPAAAEPLGSVFRMTLGALAVQVFFAISGFFIAKSFDRRSSLVDFVVARVLRLYPALIVVALVTVGVLGPTLTAWPLADYARAPAIWRYVPVTLSLRWLQDALPGLFMHNPVPRTPNGSLWTLYSEVKCYALVALLGSATLLRPRRFLIFVAAFALYQGLGRLNDPFAWRAVFVQLSLPFFIGTACYVWRDRVPLNGWLAAALAALTALSWPFVPAYAVLLSITLAYGALYLGHADLPGLRGYNRLGDYSYGMYIYAWPVQQALVALGVTTPWALTAFALPVTLACAILSWTFVEAPALRHRHRLGRAIAARLT